ncbi:MAG: GDCCVxC domain-containing (seleno)protein, partial [Gemmatimonadales bacterium]
MVPGPATEPPFVAEEVTIGKPDLATLTCPACGRSSDEHMPDDACLFFWSCPECATLIRPKPGECCVFCSYGATRCGPARRE